MQIYSNSTPSQDLKEQIKQLDTTPLQFLEDLLVTHHSKKVPEQIQKEFIFNDKNAKESYIAAGNQLTKDQKVALLVMAGGAATRLGATMPKGQFPVNNSCLFEIILNKAQEQGQPDIFILLSLATAETEQFLATKNYFGYDKLKINFIYQNEYPVVTPTGQLLSLESQILQSPNGNAGFLSPLKKEILEKYEYIHIITIDNAFSVPIDPEMVGFAKINKLEVVNRVIQVQENEKVGICAFRKNDPKWQSQSVDLTGKLPDIAPTVIEYSEIDFSKIDLQKACGSIANHLFSTDYLINIINIQQQYMAVPFHLAIKNIQYYNFENKKLENIQAVKFEHFIFDYFHFCSVDKFGLFKCERSEFMPLKELKDLPEIEKRLQKSAVKE